MNNLHRPKNVDEWIVRARAGDSAALDQLFQWYREIIGEWAKHQAARYASTGTRPSDIAQDASMRAFRKFGSFEGRTTSEWEAWLKAIVERSLWQHFRDEHRQKRDPRRQVTLEDVSGDSFKDPARSPSELTAAKESAHQVFEAMSKLLPKRQQQAIFWCHLVGERYAKVARRMDTTEAAVTLLVQRGIAQLRQRFAEKNNTLRGLEASHEAMDIFADYLRRKDAGEIVDVEAFLARHSAHAGELRSLIEWVGHIEAIKYEGPDPDEDE